MDTNRLHSIKEKKSTKWLLAFVMILFLLGLYAPFFASSKPLIVFYKGKCYFPALKFLFYKNFYSKPIDLFFNVLMGTLPLTLIGIGMFKNHKKKVLWLGSLLQIGVFCSALFFPPTSSLSQYVQFEKQIEEGIANSTVKFYIKTPIPYHWEQNALAGSTPPKVLRVNGQSLFSSLLFGIRYSFTIAILAVFMAFALGTFIGASMGFIGGKLDFLIFRSIEVWESLPTLMVLLFITSLVGHVGFFFVAFILALLSWTSIARLVRIEMIKQKNKPYVLVLKNLKVSRCKILVKHLLPNCYWILLSLIPHALIGAITYESALSFLGLGDRKSCSIGLLLDEARMVYPMEGHLFWPPALVLMAILIPLTWLGDQLRESLDPHLNENPF